MNQLHLEYLTIRNFQSLIEANIDFINFRNCFIKVSGFNSTESTATSNGSGKSSLFESILWVLYQTTSSGNKDVSNRLSEEPVSVDLQFSLNNNTYLVSRQINTVTFGRLNTETGLFDDFSATNKSETNKKILEVIGITKDLFLNTIFISQNSQNFAFSRLSPSSRKERIEELVDLDSQMSELTDKIALRLKEAVSQRDTSQRQVQSFDAKKALLMSDITSLKQQLSKVEGELLLEQSKVTENFEEKEDSLQKKLAVQEQRLEKLTTESQELLDPLNEQIRTFEDESLRLNTVIKQLQSQVDDLQNSSICPTCKRPFDETDQHSFEEMSCKLKSRIEEEKGKRRKAGIKLQTLSEKKETIISAFKKKSSEIASLISSYQAELTVIEKQKQSSKTNLSAVMANQNLLKQQISEKDKELTTTSEQYKLAVAELEVFNQRVDVVEDIKKRLIVEFRSFILGKILKQFNELLLQMSEQVFDDKKVQIVFKKTKIDIEIQSSKFSQSYESLSGGEKRKTDLVLILAQQRLLSQVTDSSSNVLILDEVLENMDEVAMNSSLNLIQFCQQQGMSVFVISHTEYQSVDFDYDIQVIKDQNGSLIEILRCQ